MDAQRMIFEALERRAQYAEETRLEGEDLVPEQLHDIRIKVLQEGRAAMLVLADDQSITAERVEAGWVLTFVSDDVVGKTEHSTRGDAVAWFAENLICLK